jgi:hypothetical protein
MMKLSHFLPALLIAMGVFMGCSAPDDKENILGIWRVKSSAVDGREVGDGLGWFDFKADGTVDTRPRPGKYDSGKYELDQDKGTIALNSNEGGMTYTYTLDGDDLVMSAMMANQMTLKLVCVKVDDYPITKDKDAPDDAIFQPR